MKRRLIEFAVIVAAVAGVVSYAGRRQAPQPFVSPPAVVIEASPVPGGLQSQPATIWKSFFDEARAALGQGDNARAEASLLSALEVTSTRSPDALAKTLDALGLVCFRQARYQRAADYQEKAIAAAEMRQETLGSATVGLYQTRYATTLEALGQHSEALKALGRAEESFKLAYPAGSPAYADAMRDLSAQYRALGDNHSAARPAR